MSYVGSVTVPHKIASSSPVDDQENAQDDDPP